MSPRRALFYIGEQPPTNTADWKFERSTGRTRLQLQFPSSYPPGTKMWLTAACINPRKQPGPACPPISTHLQGGVVSTSDLMRLAA